MGEFIRKLFESREVAHMFHLTTSKYSNHKGLESYYEDILGLIDDLAEIYQGQYGKLKDYMAIESSPSKLDDPIQYFEDLVEYVKAERYNKLKEEDAHLQAIVDEIVNLQYKTIYKLKYLK